MDYLFSDKLSKSELGISRELLKNIDVLNALSITDIAEKSYVSPAAITKYSKKLGFNGYKDLKYKLIMDNNKRVIDDDHTRNNQMKINNFFKELNTDKLSKLSKTIKQSQYICLYGKGPSLGVCKYFAPRIKAVSSIPVLVYDDEQMFDIELENINNKKTIIFLSASFKTEEIVSRIKKAKASTDNVYLICEDINNSNKLKEENVIRLINENTAYDDKHIRDRTLFFIYLELVIETLLKE